ncbi:MAG: DUF2961 domain-containing protein [Chryseolinea sp.]
MRNLSLCALLLCYLTNTSAQDFYEKELLNLSSVRKLAGYRIGEMDQLSSYDRTGGNDDGFSGKYSYVRKESGGLVMADLKGPGVVNRIWTPTPTKDTVKFYFDGEKKPRIAVPFIALFTGETFPFLAPLSGNQVGGYYCYLPIPYEKSLKIVYAGTDLKFHQTQYRTLRKEDGVKSFTNEMVHSHQPALEKIASTWNRKSSPVDEYGKNIKEKKVNFVLRSGSEHALFSAITGGRVVGIQLDAGSLANVYRKVMLTARWDDESRNAIDLPLHDFFGYAFGKTAMQSILIGSNTQKLYSYLPMPYDQSADITLRYDKGPADMDEILVTGTVFYTEDKRNQATEGKLYVQSRREYNSPSGTPHLIADIKGKGHYVGTVLISQGLEEGHTRFFEGDDRATIDGKLKLHGTGSEDYFNGGWYAVMDRWDRGISLPIHGSLDYNLMSARTGGYRFYMNDKLNFNEAFNLTIEHQPDANENVKADYTSIAYFYADRPQFENKPILIDGTVSKIARRDKLTAQGMMVTLYWLASASYDDPAMIISMKRSDKWFATIDPEAIPMAQIVVNSLDNGRYKLYVEYGKTESTEPFSIWQRSGQVSDWITAGNDTPANGKTVDAGVIEISDEVKTITIRKKAGDTSVKIISLQFEKIN